eukprot:TRINITY_DN6515_c2_g2_i1.p1 TRINITY_DN6515_c2_g2~~TRINITY_DN6515_c2_g2_i1.p1  ORF type:complete len:481 (-),score=104.68 TRINITY_DN6515_c2_g2_i1:26-1468(-)
MRARRRTTCLVLVATAAALILAFSLSNKERKEEERHEVTTRKEVKEPGGRTSREHRARVDTLSLLPNSLKEERLRRSHDRELPVVYLHLKKTAGSTLCSMAKKSGLAAIEQWGNCFWHGDRLPTAYLTHLRGDPPPNMTLLDAVMNPTRVVDNETVTGPYDFVAFEIVMSAFEPWGKMTPFNDPLSPFWRNAVHIISLRDPIVRFMSYVVHIVFQYDRHDMEKLKWNATKDLKHEMIDRLMRNDKSEVHHFAIELERFMAANTMEKFERYKATPSVFMPINNNARREMRQNGPDIMVWSLSRSKTDFKTAACNLKTHYSAILNLSDEQELTAFLAEKVLHLYRSTLHSATTRFSGMAYAENLLAHLPKNTLAALTEAFTPDICLFKLGTRFMREHAVSLGWERSNLGPKPYPHLNCDKYFHAARRCGAVYQKAVDGDYTPLPGVESTDQGKLFESELERLALQMEVEEDQLEGKIGPDTW